jgi:glycogen phosphorylase
MNEGHSAFAALERARRLMSAHGLPVPRRVRGGRGGTVFTTHTPVDAGHDQFPPSSWTVTSASTWMDARPLGRDEFMPGPHGGGRPDEPFNMTILALRMAGATNGVSRVHGR